MDGGGVSVHEGELRLRYHHFCNANSNSLRSSSQLVQALGNHDHHPSNNWPVDVDDSAWLYNHLADIWSVWLEPDALETLGRTGWFSTDVAEVGKCGDTTNSILY